MLATLFVLFLSTQISAYNLYYKKDVRNGGAAHAPSVTHNSWVWFGHNSHGGKVFVQLDTYHSKTRFSSAQHNTPQLTKTSSQDVQERLLNWAMREFHSRNHATANARPILLDVSVVEKRTTSRPMVNSDMARDRNNEKNEGDGNFWRSNARSFLFFVLLMCCVTSWVVFVLQTIKLAKRLGRQQFRIQQLRIKSRKKSESVPLLSHEGALKETLIKK